VLLSFLAHYLSFPLSLLPSVCLPFIPYFLSLFLALTLTRSLSFSLQSKLFGQYVQFDAAKLQDGAGSGLGLWISKGIVELHGGDCVHCTALCYDVPCCTILHCVLVYCLLGIALCSVAMYFTAHSFSALRLFPCLSERTPICHSVLCTMMCYL
jgi:hypothetical protein